MLGQPPGLSTKAGLRERIFDERFRIALGGNQDQFLPVKHHHAAFHAMNRNFVWEIHRDQVMAVHHAYHTLPAARGHGRVRGRKHGGTVRWRRSCRQLIDPHSGSMDGLKGGARPGIQLDEGQSGTDGAQRKIARVQGDLLMPLNTAGLDQSIAQGPGVGTQTEATGHAYSN